MTAEFATVLPAVILVLGCCLGAIAVIGQQVRLTDASADAARALSRGDAVGPVSALVVAEVPGALLAVESRGDFVCARLDAPSSVGLFSAWGLSLDATSCALGGGR
ncbi:TadE family type IV pilus minor pilin [Cryobacterium sp. MLB-32]|uniref:TadE family type IV pilus minor pilin n=1 Tax=Cryobacterium sp. MLB-32 TaxID=1529318 RepID=UPI0018CECF31|nr:TadE family type IV pilus minor pilin [Cryobacterium sp. MLB-32]